MTTTNPHSTSFNPPPLDSEIEIVGYVRSPSNIPETVLFDLYFMPQIEGDPHFYYNVDNQTFANIWVTRVQTGNYLLFVALLRGVPVGFCWVSNMYPRTGRWHFYISREIWNDPINLKVGWLLGNYSLNAADPHESTRYRFDTLTGLVPVTNTPAIKWVQKWGCKKVGRIPRICYINNINQNVDGILFYKERKYGLRDPIPDDLSQ